MISNSDKYEMGMDKMNRMEIECEYGLMRVDVIWKMNRV